MMMAVGGWCVGGRRKATPLAECVEEAHEVPLDSEGLPDFEALERLGDDDDDDDDCCEIVGAKFEGVQCWVGECVEVLDPDADGDSEEVFPYQFREDGGWRRMIRLR